MEKMLSQAVRDALATMGWRADRRIDTSQWVANLSSYGLPLLPGVDDIIANFGGLTLRGVPSAGKTFQPPVVFFDPVNPGGDGDVDRVPYWQEILGTALNPIADLGAGHAVLLLSDERQLLAGLNGGVYWYGDSFEDALEETLIFGKRVPVQIK